MPKGLKPPVQPRSLGRLAAYHVHRVVSLRNCGFTGPDERIHDFRTAVKRQRAYWRLISPLIPGGIFRREKKRLGIAGRRLSAGRNESAVLDGMEKIARDARGGRETDSAGRVLTALRKHLGRSDARNRALRNLSREQSVLEESLKEFLRLSPASCEWNLLEPGIDHAYKKARKAGRISSRSTRQKFHHWRKKVKDLWYQLSTLQSPGPSPRLNKLLHRLDALQKLLGDGNDLAILDDLIRKNPARFGGASAGKDVAGLIKRRIAAGKRKALGLGGKIFAQKPGVFIEALKPPPV